jgi:hypothetical protein
MKTTQSSGTDPVPQTVAGSFQFKNNGKAMAISFTDQRLSPQAGSAIFRGWLPRVDGGQGLAAALPHRLPQSSNHLLPLEKALAFMHGLLGDARKLTPVACLRRDPLVPERIGIKRIASPSGLSRFFQGFNSAATKLRCFRPLWPWGQNRLPSVPAGYPLDLDSTRLLDEDGHQAGVAVGYPRQGLKPCLPPLLAVLAEVRLVAQLWLRPGNAPCGSNVVAFFLDLWENLPDRRRLGGVRADAGFCLPELLAPWEPLPPPLAVWRYYNGRADSQNVIKELREGFALPTLCLEPFWASEAALSLATLTYNLTGLFQRPPGWQQKVTIQSLRFWLLVTTGGLSHPGGQTTIKLAMPERKRGWWRRLWEKILSPFPNGNAVENRPAFSP